MRRRGQGLLLLGGALTIVGACATGGPPPTPGQALHRAKCSSCHVRPDAARFDRAHWSAVLSEHRSRLRLSETEWRQLLDHLAPPPAAP